MARTGNDYIPRPDGDFDVWAVNYYDAVKTWWQNQGLNKDDLDPLVAALNTWRNTYPAHTSAQAAAESAAQAKVTARTALEQAVRPIARFVQAFPATTDADRAGIGLSVRSTARRGVPPPATRPILSIDTAQRLSHTLRICDEATPTRRTKPPGAIGAEVWRTIIRPGQPAPAPTEPPRYLALATKTPHTLTFKAHDGGATAVYMLRWVTKSGECGPWSEEMRATVAA